jgi:hypothetical protein
MAYEMNKLEVQTFYRFKDNALWHKWANIHLKFKVWIVTECNLCYPEYTSQRFIFHPLTAYLPPPETLCSKCFNLADRMLFAQIQKRINETPKDVVEYIG